jgi:hypothetical protein
MKWMVPLVLLFAATLIAENVPQPSQNLPEIVSQELTAIPDAVPPDLDGPAVTSTVTVDSVTLPLDIGTLQSHQLAYSIAQPSGDSLPLSFQGTL